MKPIVRQSRPRAAGMVRQVLGCVAASLLFACGGDDGGDARSPQASGAAKAPAGPALPDETGLEGTFGADTQVPAGFPTDIPVYPGAKPTASMSSEGEGTLVTFDSNDAAQLVFDFYEEKLVDNGWSLESSANMADQWMLSAFKDGRNAHISIASAPAGSQIGVAVARAP